ncbi:MAG: hypothetical protein K2O61_02780, partial [Bacteroidaceae bacterium]|nr:hypothetical protein [Bacteroidaceae bacterium]
MGKRAFKKIHQHEWSIIEKLLLSLSPQTHQRQIVYYFLTSCNFMKMKQILAVALMAATHAMNAQVV